LLNRDSVIVQIVLSDVETGVVIVCMSGSFESWGLNSTHTRGTLVPVEEPSTASKADFCAWCSKPGSRVEIRFNPSGTCLAHTLINALALRQNKSDCRWVRHRGMADRECQIECKARLRRARASAALSSCAKAAARKKWASGKVPPIDLN
jgi:hypothetical protein